jgi:hypothetical protein
VKEAQERAELAAKNALKELLPGGYSLTIHGYETRFIVVNGTISELPENGKAFETFLEENRIKKLIMRE